MSLLERIKELGAKQVELEQKKTTLEDQTKQVNKDLEVIRGGHQQEGQLPQAMQEAEMTTFTLESGAKITIKEQLLPPSLAKDAPTREPILKWVDDKGHGDAIKNSITIFFAKGDQRKQTVEEGLKAEGIDFESFATMHPGTLKALLKELLEAGEDVPLDELQIKVFRQSEVK